MIIDFKTAIIGVAKIIPKIPQKYPNTNKPNIIVTGCNFIVLLITIGWKKFPSKNWIITITTKAKIPILMSCEKATITAGAPPIYGPANGITLVIPQKRPNNSGELTPTAQSPKAVTINTIVDKMTVP